MEFGILKIWILNLFWAFPSVGLSAISFIPLKLHKRIPPLSLTLKRGSKVQRFKGTKVFYIVIE